MKQMLALAANELTPAEKESLEAHLQKCQRCAKAYENHQRSSSLLQRLPHYQANYVLPPHLAKQWAGEAKASLIPIVIDRRQTPHDIKE